MANRFVRQSKFKHVYPQPFKKNNCYDNAKVTTNAWDSNLIKVNPKFMSINWKAGGGGAFGKWTFDVRLGSCIMEICSCS
jgi:coronin-1B/1C/6